MNHQDDNELMKRIVLCVIAMLMLTTLAFCSPEPSLNPTVAYVSN